VSPFAGSPRQLPSAKCLAKPDILLLTHSMRSRRAQRSSSSSCRRVTEQFGSNFVHPRRIEDTERCQDSGILYESQCIESKRHSFAQLLAQNIPGISYHGIGETKARSWQRAFVLAIHSFRRIQPICSQLPLFSRIYKKQRRGRARR
jgi:hypothetical protein